MNCEVDFYKIRKTSKGQRDSFESLVCSLFHKKFDQLGEYQCYRGDGGDGGVEAIFICPDNSEIGVQAKFWENNEFGSSQKSQLDDSLKTALENHLKLKTYYVAIPFDLTGNVSAGKRKSQTQRFDEWKSKSEELYSIKIELWSKSVLCDILQEVDISKGLQRYWFDFSILSEDDHLQHIEQIVNQAGKRYTPTLNIKVPLLGILDSFAEFKFIINQCDFKVDELSDKFLSNHYFKDAWNDKSNDICEHVNSLIEKILALKNKKDFFITAKQIQSICDSQLKSAAECEQSLLFELQEKYGDKFVDNDRFRQFMAQYMCEFPAAKLDKIREYESFIDDVSKWIQTDAIKAAFSNFLVVKGPAGIGKTHSIVDYASGARNMFHYVFFGSDFNNEEPWLVILKKLGLPLTLSKNELFGLLDARAESLKCISILFIDALNESQNKTKWKDWLTPLIQDISHFPHLKLCVTCRDTYLSDVFDDMSKYIVIKHNGFEGQEQQAIRSFFDFYKLKEPIYPLLSKEFSNPLFLHLFCQSFPEGTFADFPKGKIGLEKIFNRYIIEKNKIISKKCDLDPEENSVKSYLMSLACEMSSQNALVISRKKAKEISTNLHYTNRFSESLFSVFEKEGLLSFFKEKTVDEFGDNQYVRFTYERMADYFVALNLIENESKLNEVLVNGKWLSANKGVLEILAILLPELKEKELFDYVSFTSFPTGINVFLESLPRRSNKSISQITVDKVFELSKQGPICEQVWFSCLCVATIPNNPLNIIFWENVFFTKKQMCDRDPDFAFIIRNSYEKKESAYKLIDIALTQDLKYYERESLLLWAKTLCWLFGNPDRRVRDKSSKAFVRIMLVNFDFANMIIEHFQKVDDEYITERIFESIYASLLLSKNPIDCFNIAKKIIDNKYLEKYENVIIHDTCRLIIELAYKYDNTFVSNCTYSKLINKQPNKVFEKTDELLYQQLILKSEFSSPNINFVGKWYTDFQRYVLVRNLEHFDIESKGILKDDIYKWFVVKLHELGYPGERLKCWRYDTMTLDKYGFDRMRAVYAERLSKKYYWILLHRLVGLLQNTVSYKKKSWDETPDPAEPRLYSLDLRQIDLTDIRYNCERKYPSLIWSIPSFKSKETNEKWLNGDSDFFDVDYVIGALKDENGNFWIPLHLYKDEKLRSQESDYNYKDSCILVVAYLSTKEYIESLSKKDLDLFVSDVQNDSNEYQLYLGEYPIARSYHEKVECGEIVEHHYQCDKLNKTSFVFLRGREWGYDCSYSDLDEEEIEKLAESIKFPSKMLITLLGLNWDGNSGWLNSDNCLICFQNKEGLFIAKDALNSLLGGDNALLMNVYREKIYSENGESGMKAKRCAYKWTNNGIECVRKVEE